VSRLDNGSRLGRPLSRQMQHARRLQAHRAAPLLVSFPSLSYLSELDGELWASRAAAKQAAEYKSQGLASASTAPVDMLAHRATKLLQELDARKKKQPDGKRAETGHYLVSDLLLELLNPKPIAPQPMRRLAMPAPPSAHGNVSRKTSGGRQQASSTADALRDRQAGASASQTALSSARTSELDDASCCLSPTPSLAQSTTRGSMPPAASPRSPTLGSACSSVGVLAGGARAQTAAPGAQRGGGASALNPIDQASSCSRSPPPLTAHPSNGSSTHMHHHSSAAGAEEPAPLPPGPAQRVASAPAQHPSGARSANSVYRSGDYLRTIQIAASALHSQPREPVLHRIKGMAHARLRQHDEAVVEASRAIDADPLDPLGYIQRANGLAQLGRMPAAGASLLRAMRAAAAERPRHPVPSRGPLRSGGRLGGWLGNSLRRAGRASLLARSLPTPRLPAARRHLRLCLRPHLHPV
jgi:tetratricopeptide (TPR) repeat protein